MINRRSENLTVSRRTLPSSEADAGGDDFRRFFGELLMSAALRSNFKLCHPGSLSLHLHSETLPHFLSIPAATLYRQLIQLACFSSSNSFPIFSKFDFLEQFSPHGNSCSSSFETVVNSNERRKLAVGISEIIKQRKGYLLQQFSSDFCPFKLFEIMKKFETQQISFAFFKYVFRDHSDCTIRHCCVLVRLLVFEEFRVLGQDVLTWIIQEIGENRSYKLVWGESCKNASSFLILDTVMRSFTNAEMAHCALEVLGRIFEVGCRPKQSAICNLVKLLLRLGDYGSVWKLFRDMLRRGPIPSIYVFNMMILGFSKRGAVSVAESLLFIMSKFWCDPDVHSYNILINAYCAKGRAWDALGLLRLMVDSGCHPSPTTFCMLVNAFCKDGNVVGARKIFDAMEEMDVLPNTFLYNALMDGYIKAREIDLANKLFEEMTNNGVAPDGVTFNILAAGHCKYGKEVNGDELVRNISRMAFFPNWLSDMSIEGLCWAGKLDEALELLKKGLDEGIPTNVIAYNSLIVAYAKAGLEDKAFEVYNIMVRFGTTPSASTCTSLLLSLCKTGRLREAGILIHKMAEKGYRMSRAAFTVVFDGYFKNGDIIEAQDIWKEMEMCGMAPDAVAFSAFIDGLSRWGYVEEAYDMYVRMTRKGLVPNNFVFNSLISGFCSCGKMNEALTLEMEMRERGLLPDIITFNIFINGFCKQGRMKSAMDAYVEMHRHGVSPDIVTYNTLISGYCNQLDMLNAENLANRLQTSGWDLDIYTYNIQIHGSCRTMRMNRAVVLLNELISAGIVPDTVTYNTLLNGICHDILDRAMVLTAKLLKMAFVPDLVTINMLLSNLHRQGLPHRTVMWARKLQEISFEFDEITHNILDKAYHDIEDVTSTKEITAKSFFLDFLMYITYDFVHRNQISRKMSFDPLDFIDRRFRTNMEAMNK
ncbi:pentatricopeptide repeat-containing protein At1g63150-like [Andrographis paniculata]|uniref:pentatricopeptide repeat-containing protein At1g63150-like n=1 Tax=Andrographis paniculata TaxID=175694 RepID=UPI0021E81992|nr:pentatricopeptide repeat-containing protein At1g63150-like [Andrographis paniculata]